MPLLRFSGRHKIRGSPGLAHVEVLPASTTNDSLARRDRRWVLAGMASNRAGPLWAMRARGV
jgi:hypothetical protein